MTQGSEVGDEARNNSVSQAAYTNGGGGSSAVFVGPLQISLLLFYLTVSPHMLIQLTCFSLQLAAFRLILVKKASSGYVFNLWILPF